MEWGLRSLVALISSRPWRLERAAWTTRLSEGCRCRHCFRCITGGTGKTRFGHGDHEVVLGNPPNPRWRVRATLLFLVQEWGGGERRGEDGLGLLTVGARPERRRETPRSISIAIPAAVPEQKRVEVISHANAGVGGIGGSQYRSA